MQPMMDMAEKRSLIMLGRRAQVMAFYAVMFGFMILLLKNPDDFDAFTAYCLVALFGLISLYYFISEYRSFLPRFLYVSAQIADDQMCHMIQRDGKFRVIAHGIFIVLSFAFIAYLGIF